MELINVITIENNNVKELVTFANIDEQDMSGVEEAEKYFEEKVYKIATFKDDVDIETALENGYYENGNTTVSIYHSGISNIQI